MKKTLPLILYSMIIITAIILADAGRLPLGLIAEIPHYDKAAHMIFYGILFWLLNDFLSGKRIRMLRSQPPLAFMITAVFISLEEVSQIFFSSRTFSLVDLLMGFLGIFLIVLAGRVRFRLRFQFRLRRE